MMIADAHKIIVRDDRIEHFCRATLRTLSTNPGPQCAWTLSAITGKILNLFRSALHSSKP
jgi:hypothetical protein